MSRLLAGDRSGFEGELFRLAARAPASPTRRSASGCRSSSARWSPRLTAFAAEQADELKLGGSANPAMVRLARERLGAADVGIVAGAVTVVDRDGARAREHARRRVAMYLDVVAGLDPTAGVRAELLAALARARSRPATRPARRRSSPTRRSTCSPSRARPTRSPRRRRRSSTPARAASSSARRTGSTSAQGVELLAREVVPRLGL